MQQTDLKLYKSKVVSDSAGNGGREGATEVVSGVLANVFPKVGQAERIAGGSRWRKISLHPQVLASSCKAFLSTLSTAEDHFALVAGGHTDTQGDLTGTEKMHASGSLNGAAAAGATQVVVNFEDAADVDLANGDALWIYGINGQMFNTVSGAPSWNGNQATITLGSQLNVDYPQGSICAMVLEIGTLQPSFDTWAETSAAGTYDEATYPPTLAQVGTVRDDFTITFTSATAFSCSGLYEGAVGTGQVSQDFSPINPATGTPYFTIDKDGWGGTWAIGNTVTFKTYPASKGLWLKEIWPAGASAQENVVYLDIDAE
jgi:hypothetical protein